MGESVRASFTTKDFIMNRLVILFCLLLGGLAIGQMRLHAAQQQYDSGDPTANEQYVLEIINRARANPAAEGTRLGIDINAGLPAGQTATAKPPLAMNKILLGTARTHSADMYTRKFFAHTNPDLKDPFQRMNAAGYNFNSAGENIAASSNNSADALEDNLMVDKGDIGVGHRVNLLNTDPSTPFREIGIGYFSGAAPITGSLQVGVNGLKDFLTQDFGMTAVGPFIVGVVYKDANTNNFYDPGEGLAGVTITPDSGNFFAITGTAGGFAIPVGTTGTVMLTATGGALTAPLTMKVNLAGVNVKADFNVTTAGSGGGATAPKITSALAASGTQNADFSYTVTASGTQPITFTQTGLPFGLMLSGSSITGQSSQAGQFMVTLTATNSAGTDSQVLVLTIAPQAIVSGSTIDTDGDGFPDELETLLKTSPTNKNDTPFGGAPATPLPLTLTSEQIRLNFASTNKDSMTLAGTLPILAGFSISGKTATLDVGGVMRTFTFDSKGLSNTPGVAMFKIRIKAPGGVVGAQNAPFTIRLSNGNFAPALQDEGLANATVTTMNTVPVIILFNNQFLISGQQRTYTAHANQSGVLK